MDAATVDQADPTNANVYLGNLSAEVPPSHAHRCSQGSQAMWHTQAGAALGEPLRTAEPCCRAAG